MFYLMITFIIVLLILFFLKDKQFSNELFILILSYCLAFLCIILYIVNDYYYSNLIKQYFYFPPLLWRWFYLIRIPKIPLIRVLNITSLLVPVVSVYFSLHFHPLASVRMEKNLKAIVIIYSTIVALFYDPSITKIMYYSFYPNIVTAHQYRILETHINGITKSVNTIVMVCGFIWLLLAIRFTPRLKLFQQKFIVMSASYGILTFFYVFFISAAPQFFLEISKVSDTYSFRSISLQRNFFIYQTLPYILIIALVGITYSALILAKLNKKLDIAELCIAKEIDASETTSKIFCHYIKNEILSISS